MIPYKHGQNICDAINHPNTEMITMESKDHNDFGYNVRPGNHRDFGCVKVMQVGLAQFLEGLS